MYMPLHHKSNPTQVSNGHNGYLIELRQVVKTYESAAGKFTALKGIDLQVRPGEFVAHTVCCTSMPSGAVRPVLTMCRVLSASLNTVHSV